MLKGIHKQNSQFISQDEDPLFVTHFQFFLQLISGEKEPNQSNRV